MKFKQTILTNVLLIISQLLCSCNNSESELSGFNDDPIVGKWELISVIRAFGGEETIPTEKRDMYIFKLDGKVLVFNKNTLPYFMDAGEYDYTHDTNTSTLKINGLLRSCVIADNTMTIGGDFYDSKDGTITFTLKKIDN